MYNKTRNIHRIRVDSLRTEWKITVHGGMGEGEFSAC